MWQVSRSGKFEEYDPDFCEGTGGLNDPEDFPLGDISENIDITNFYV